MTGDYGNIQVYLGDGRAQPQRERLIEALAEILGAREWSQASCVGAERMISVGRAERWLTLFDSLQLEQPEEHGGFCADLSRHFPLVSLRWWGAPAAEDAALELLLYRDGELLDCLAKGSAAKEGRLAAASRMSAEGRPAAWTDLLGSPRNSARLEIAWGGASLAGAVFESTAEIVGFDPHLCRRGWIDAETTDDTELRSQLERGAITGWTGLGFSRR